VPHEMYGETRNLAGRMCNGTSNKDDGADRVVLRPCDPTDRILDAVHRNTSEERGTSAGIPSNQYARALSKRTIVPSRNVNIRSGDLASQR
jgi:hypothetical protein